MALDERPGTLERQRLAILEALADAVFMTDTQGALTYLNPAWEAIMGFPAARALGMPLLSYLLPEDRAAGLAQVPALLAGELEACRFEARYLARDGTKRWLDAAIQVVRGDDGAITGAVGRLTDVTQRREAEAEAAAERDFCAAVVDAVGSLVLVLDATGRAVRLNAVTCQLLGIADVAAAGGLGWELLLPAAEAAEERRRTQRSTPADYPRRCERTLVDRGGEARRFAWHETAIAAPDGSLAYVVCVGTDVTAQRRTEERLRRREAQLVEAQRVARMGSWELDLVTRQLTWSDELHALYGRPVGTGPLSPAALAEHAHPDDRAAIAERLAAAEAGEPGRLEFRIPDPAGTRHLSGEIEVIRNEVGCPVRLVGILQDVTAQRVVDQLKDEFVGIVSHELRTPLTAIRGSLGLLASGALGKLPDRGQRMLEIASTSSERLVRLINDILDVERLRAGRLPIHPEPLPLAPALAQALEAVQGQADGFGVRLELRDAGELQALADADRLAQVLSNLLGNALKFTPSGGRVILGARATSGDMIEIAVADEGRGIPAAQLQSVFERFNQVDPSDTREKGGTGLGLAICRAIVELHGGRIWAESSPDMGSTFRFTLPRA